MSQEKGYSNPQHGELLNEPKQNLISRISKKGITLGAQHASHGDNGAPDKGRKNSGAQPRDKK